MHPLARRASLLACTLVAFAACKTEVAVGPGPRFALAQPLTAEQQAWLKKARRSEADGWTLLRVEGGARERGFQHGFLMAKEIAESLRIRRARWLHRTGMEWDWLLAKTRTIFTSKVDPENLAEIDGIVEGMAAASVATTRDDVVALNAWAEIDWYWWPQAKKSIAVSSEPPVKDACSAFIATGSATADGRIVVGHNTWGPYDIGIDFSLVLDLVPARGHRIVMQAAPGLVHSGTDWFMTDAGLVGTETTIDGFSSFDEGGVPEFVRFRRATQDASSIDEWVAVMKRGNNGGYANAWLLGDVRTNEIARLELGLKYVGFERTMDGYFVGSNIAEDLKILRLETDTADSDIRQSVVARRVRWHQLMKERRGKIDAEAGKAMLADHLDVHTKAQEGSCRSLCGHCERDPLGWSALAPPFNPGGAYDAKVADAEMVKRLVFAARWGSPCGTAFDAERFLSEQPQFGWLQGTLRSRPARPWTLLPVQEAPAGPSP